MPCLFLQQQFLLHWHTILLLMSAAVTRPRLILLLLLAGLTYIGWIGSYLFDLRNLPEGGWWFMLVMSCVWLGDSGAYSIGRAYGKHKMAPRLSPKKSWEGYAASVFTGMIGRDVLCICIFHICGGNLAGDITIWQGAILGLILGATSTSG